uniref:Uncharacterized protein n=1 Tax=Marinobacter nauticus TaxID=2743 RepID=A0A455W8M9_MARNT|nr:hypothetical protein YBY_33600 [Marinobacter nauticus]
MAGAKRTWVRQAFMKQSFMRSRTTAICDCWLDPLAGARSVFREGDPALLPDNRHTPGKNSTWTENAKIAYNKAI